MRKIAIVSLAASLAAGADAQADGMLDPSVGKGGLVTTNFPGVLLARFLHAVALAGPDRI